MKRFIAREDKYSNSISEYKKGKWHRKYFHLYCDKCGVKHPDVCVNSFDEGDKFGKCDLCWNCQKEMKKAKNGAQGKSSL